MPQVPKSAPPDERQPQPPRVKAAGAEVVELPPVVEPWEVEPVVEAELSRVVPDDPPEVDEALVLDPEDPVAPVEPAVELDPPVVAPEELEVLPVLTIDPDELLDELEDDAPVELVPLDDARLNDPLEEVPPLVDALDE